MLAEGRMTAERVYELIRKSEKGYVYLQYSASLQVDPIDDSSGIGDSFGVQHINPKGAQSSWLDSVAAEGVTVADVRDFGQDLDEALSSLFEQVQAAWGKRVDHTCFVEALRHELHILSSKKLHTAYFHSIDLSGRPDGPTLVREPTSRLGKDADGSATILEEPLEVRRKRPGAPAFAISNADDGLAGRHRACFPGISLPFGILSWPLTSALLHCEDAGKGAYNLLLSGGCKIWYIVPIGKHAAFLQYLSQSIPGGVGLSYIKQLLPLIPGDVLTTLEIVRIVQKPLQAVITLPGLVFHYTISTGTSEAEAVNFHLDLPGREFAAIWRGWCQYAKRCAEDLSRMPKPQAMALKQLKRSADERHCIVRSIGTAMGLSCQEIADAPVSEKGGPEQILALEKSEGCCQTAEGQKPGWSWHRSERLSREGDGENAEKTGNVVIGALGRKRASKAGTDRQGGTAEQTLQGCKGKNSSTAVSGGTPGDSDTPDQHSRRGKRRPAAPAEIKVGDEVSLAELDHMFAAVKKHLFTESVPKQKYIKLQQENVRLAAECKEAQNLAAERLALLKEFKALSQKMDSF